MFRRPISRRSGRASRRPVARAEPGIRVGRRSRSAVSSCVAALLSRGLFLANCGRADESPASASRPHRRRDDPLRARAHMRDDAAPAFDLVIPSVAGLRLSHETGNRRHGLAKDVRTLARAHGAARVRALRLAGRRSRRGRLDVGRPPRAGTPRYGLADSAAGLATRDRRADRLVDRAWLRSTARHGDVRRPPLRRRSGPRRLRPISARASRRSCRRAAGR